MPEYSDNIIQPYPIGSTYYNGGTMQLPYMNTQMMPFGDPMSAPFADYRQVMPFGGMGGMMPFGGFAGHMFPHHFTHFPFGFFPFGFGFFPFGFGFHPFGFGFHHFGF